MSVKYKVEFNARITLMGERPWHDDLMFLYDPAEPYTVILRIPGANGKGGDNDWQFARDLLAEALAGVPAGLGDVRIWPDGDTGMMTIKLESNEGKASIRLS